MEMAYSSSNIGESLDELKCPVCFELYKEPIALPCGHSFCRVCTETSWESREEYIGCAYPNCHEVFPQNPKLKKNVTIAELVENIEIKKRGVDVHDAERGDVKSEGTDSYSDFGYTF
uniref:RING-type domain-containing protein n=1 Tax=Eptatretus burgeri TaxID=7764 RepID=A0A8C4NDT1_EPTBU